jgi:hypothetical protein
VGTLFVYHDFFWLIHQNPYKYKVDIYGSGELLHFVKHLKSITGLPLLFLSIPGFLVALYNLFKKGINLKNPEFEEILLIMLPLATYFAAHSYIWWKGIGASIGLIRVMTCIIPLWIFYSVKGLDFLLDYTRKFKYVNYIILTLAAYFIVITPFRVYAIPVPRGGSHNVIKRAADWMLENNLRRYKIFYFEPYLTTALSMDSYDQKACNEQVYDRKQPSNGIPDSSIIVWDAQFGPNEGGVPLETIMKDPKLKLLKLFKPEVSFNVLGNHPYEVYVFQKSEAGNSEDNYNIAKKTAEEERPGFNLRVLQANGFEKADERKELISDSILFHSGKFSIMLDTVHEYSLTFQRDGKVFEKTKKPVLRASIYCYMMDLPEKASLTLVASLENSGKIYDYRVSNLSELSPKKGQWTNLVLEYALPEIKSKKDVLKVYLWQRGKPVIMLDDYQIEIFYKE